MSLQASRTNEISCDPYVLGDVECRPGERRNGLVPVAVTAAGVTSGIPVMVVNGVEPGPVLALAAGVHGDEYDGMAAVRRVIADLDPSLLRGTVVGLPCVNLAAFESASRESGIDHANLNRIFPGDATGSLSQRLAATYVRDVVPAIDALVDLHTGGIKGEIVPLVIVQAGFEDLALPMGRATGHSLLWRGGSWGGTARISTLQAGKPAITVEVGGGVYREDTVASHVRTMQRILGYLEMTAASPEPAPREPQRWVDGTFSRVSSGGFLEVLVSPGDECRAGDTFARVVDHYGHEREALAAPADGIILWIRHIRTVEPGDDVVIYGILGDEVAR